MSVLWQRDIEVQEIIKHFDHSDRRDNWESLGESEIQVILKEIERCRNDFSYAARNYFWIQTKDGEDIPFQLWESQELILERWYWLRHKFPNKSQRIMILKARQLGCSTVIEGLIAWATIFFSNRNAMVVSHDDSHAAYLYGIMTHILDMLPWWLQPMVASRKQETGLFFANPDASKRRENPGNQSLVTVQSAMQVNGVGRGMRLNAVHLSEYASWEWSKFSEIIDGDMIHALANNRNSFAFLESTGKGAGSPSEDMWQAQVDLAEDADWLPVFIPWFFEKTRVEAPPDGWRPERPEEEMREKIAKDWVLCDNQGCGHYFESNFRRVSRVDQPCSECSTGVLRRVILTDEQLRFMRGARINAERKGPDAIKKLREELASTAEESFQLSGIQVFSAACHEWVNLCVDKNPLIWGNIDDHGGLHYSKDPHTGRCGMESCKQDHRYEDEHPLQIWELPVPGAQYSIGVDVAEGLGGKADYSVIFVNKVSPNGRWPDEQVALWRSNTVDPIALASPVNWLGRLYNEAMVSIEVNKFDSCFNTVRLQYLYPNMFVWKHYDSKNPISQKLGWVTNLRSKPMLWQTATRWLKSHLWIIRSYNFAYEMKRFQKDDYDDQRASAERNFNDDELIAGMIALFCAHDMDYNEDMNFIPVHSRQDGVKIADWDNLCERCKTRWDSDGAPGVSCPHCRCMMIQSHRNAYEGHNTQFDIMELGKTEEEMEVDQFG